MPSVSLLVSIFPVAPAMDSIRTSHSQLTSQTTTIYFQSNRDQMLSSENMKLFFYRHMAFASKMATSERLLQDSWYYEFHAHIHNIGFLIKLVKLLWCTVKPKIEHDIAYVKQIFNII